MKTTLRDRAVPAPPWGRRTKRSDEEEELTEEPPRSKRVARSLLLRLPPPPGLKLRTGCSDCIPRRGSSQRAVVRSRGRPTPTSKGEEEGGDYGERGTKMRTFAKPSLSSAKEKGEGREGKRGGNGEERSPIYVRSMI